jgi:hypothetical protein
MDVEKTVALEVVDTLRTQRIKMGYLHLMPCLRVAAHCDSRVMVARHLHAAYHHAQPKVGGTFSLMQDKKWSQNLQRQSKYQFSCHA